MKRDSIREKVFAPRERETKESQAFGSTIVLHKLTYAQTQEARKAAIESDQFNVDWYNVALLVLSAHDEDGNSVFEPTDRDELLQSDTEEMDALISDNMALQGMTKKAFELGKNGLRRIGNDGPSSASVASSDDSPQSSSGASPTGSSSPGPVG